METIIQTVNGITLEISKEEYLDFKIGDEYYTSINESCSNIIRTQREADLANRKIKPEYYLEGMGGKHLIINYLQPKTT